MAGLVRGFRFPDQKAGISLNSRRTTPVNTSTLKAREIEALAFTYSAPRWSTLFSRAWAALKKRLRRPAEFRSAGDWTFPGL